MAGGRGSANGGGSGTRAARGAAEGRASAHSRAPRRTLTIGEAAARLSAEFTGVTAAVLRRLEASGQFTPARSSSGYRRYSEADLDLLRIVLANQSTARPAVPAARATGQVHSPEASGPDPADLSGAEHPLTHPAAGQSAAEEALAVIGVAQDRSTGRTRHTGHQAPHGAATRGLTRTAAPSRVPAARSAAVEDSRGPEDPQGAADRCANPAGQAGSQSQRPDENDASTARTAPAAAAANGSPSAAGQSPAGTARRAERRWPDAEFFAPDLGEVALDRDQLAAAARTDRAWVDGLVEYGLLADSRSAGGADLLVARAAAELAQFGMEPRHLRAVAASAARVAELITSATSTGAARDPARRERALLAAPGRSAEAAAAAVRLHAALVRAALLRG